MELILAHHEMFMLVLQYGLTLILGGWICFKHLFPLLGRWIVDLNCKLQNRIAKLKADEDKWKQGVREKFEEDVAMILEQPEEPTTEEFFATESQIARVLKKQEAKQEAQKRIQRLADDKCVIDGLYMDQSEIESAYSGRWIQEEQPEEPGTEEHRRRK